MSASRLPDDELARLLLNETGTAEVPSVHTVERWIAEKIVNCRREYDEDKAWRAVLPRARGIAALAGEIVAASGQQQLEGAPGRGLPPTTLPAEASWENDGVQRIAGMTIAEINAMPLSEYAAFRHRAGLNGQGRGLLSQEEQWT